VKNKGKSGRKRKRKNGEWNYILNENFKKYTDYAKGRKIKIKGTLPDTVPHMRNKFLRFIIL
jgi:hypothetical protein